MKKLRQPRSGIFREEVEIHGSLWYVLCFNCFSKSLGPLKLENPPRPAVDGEADSPTLVNLEPEAPSASPEREGQDPGCRPPQEIDPTSTSASAPSSSVDASPSIRTSDPVAGERPHGPDEPAKSANGSSPRIVPRSSHPI